MEGKYATNGHECTLNARLMKLEDECNRYVDLAHTQ